MNGFHSQLFRLAKEAAKAAQQDIARLRNEILELEKRKTTTAATLELAICAVNRFDHFEPVIDGKLQCPVCWVERGIRSQLFPISRPEGERACYFECCECNLQYSMPI